MMLEHGRIAATGATVDVIETYLSRLHDGSALNEIDEMIAALPADPVSTHGTDQRGGTA